MSRILLIFSVLLVFSAKVFSEPGQAYYSAAKVSGFTIFEENGKVGLKNEQGHVLIPAQYEAMGWSNGEFSIVENVTGYRINGLWGLINVNNNKITKARYLDLSPAEGSLIVARKKIEGTVRIQTGCITASGKEVIPFIYDGLSISSFRAIVYSRNGYQFKHGLINFDNKILIPLSYQNIYPLGSLRYGVENFENKTAIFSEDGQQLTSFLIDSLSSYKKGYAIIYQNQRQGLIDRQGQIKLEPTYREIGINDDGSVNARQADAWLFLDGENKLLRQFNADSIEPMALDFLSVKTGGRILITDKEFKPVNDQLFNFVGLVENGRAIFKTGNKTGVINTQGEVVVKPAYTDLISEGPFIRAVKQIDNKQRWVILDSAGNAMSLKSYEYVGKYNGYFFPVKNRGFWGAVNNKGKEIVACVYDSLLQQSKDRIVVKFRGHYGIIDTNEEWLITPQPYKIQLISDERYLLITPKTKFLKSVNGRNIIYFSDNRLEAHQDHLLEYLPSGDIWRIDLNGVIRDRSVKPYEIEKKFKLSEGLLAIKEDGRYGFIDDQGRLRIANRYEDVKDFSETLAAVRIRGRWGFINHQDQIAIQPVYDEVFPFKQGHAMVRQKEFYGVADRNGKLTLPVRYDSIVAVSKRFKIKQNGLWGLSDANGKMIINPKFDQLTDLENGFVIVSRDGKSGLLTRHGVSTIPLLYDALSYDPYHDQFIALRKSSWETVKF